MKKFILISLMFYNAAIWTDAYAAEKDFMGIPTKSHAFGIATGVAIMADWGTTLDIERNYDEGFFETNSYLGRYPSRGDINRFFIMKLAGHIFVNTFKPVRKLKNFWNLYQGYVSYSAVNHNIKAGLEVKF